MSDVLLECRDVVAGYGDVEVLHGVTMGVRAGTITALLGSNGAGKTTLMRAIAGTLPLQSGVLIYCGKRVEKLDPAERVAAGIALVPEGRFVFRISPSGKICGSGGIRFAPGPGSSRAWTKCTRCFRGCSSVAVGRPERSRAASSKCWRWRAG